MIFVTVGAQMPFDRLISWVDDWAEQTGRDDLVAQIGPSNYVPRRMKVLPFMTPPEFREQLTRADLVIAHAGMGTIINALELGKPIVVVPRLAAREETRNDHQVATARRLSEEGLVRYADAPDALSVRIAEIEAQSSSAVISPTAEVALLDRLRHFAEN